MTGEPRHRATPSAPAKRSWPALGLAPAPARHLAERWITVYESPAFYVQENLDDGRTRTFWNLVESVEL